MIKTIKNNLANFLTLSRIIIGLVIFFISFPSFEFYLLYGIGILTDMLDGTVARITNSASELGSKLDTIADFIFMGGCVIRFLLNVKTVIVVYLLMAIVFSIKLFTIERYFRINREFYCDHSVLNKIIGFSLSLIPFLMLSVNTDSLLIAMSVFSLYGALVEHLKSFD